MPLLFAVSVRVFVPLIKLITPSVAKASPPVALSYLVTVLPLTVKKLDEQSSVPCTNIKPTKSKPVTGVAVMVNVEFNLNSQFEILSALG